jgi:four helix bundle protein
MGPGSNLIVELSFSFALNVVRFAEKLESQKKYTLANQLIRSGTSIGANVREAQGAESRKDFIHKLRIAYKEAEETTYWIELVQALYQDTETESLLLELTSVKKVLNKIISSSQKST